MVRAFTEDFDRSKQDETEETVCLSKDEPSQPAKEWVVLRKFPQGKRLSTRPVHSLSHRAQLQVGLGGEGSGRRSGIKTLQAWQLSDSSLTGK